MIFTTWLKLVSTYVTVVSVGDALGQWATSDPMSSCLARHFGCKGDLILFITGAGSTRQHLWAAVLALLVLRPLLVPNALVCNELNYWVGRYISIPCVADLGIRIGWQPSSADKKIRRLIIFFINMNEMLGGTYGQCGGPQSVPTSG